MDKERSTRVTQWLDLVGDLLHQPVPEFPVAEVALALSSTFRVGGVSWDLLEQASPEGLVEGGAQEASILGRAHDEYDACDLELAHSLQRLIRGLYLHTAAASERAQPETDSGASAERLGLTATEHAVLVLLTEGHTTYGIARRLEMAPRTASKHLEHIYRKLDVTHRVAAVNAAQAAGLVDSRRDAADQLTRDARAPGVAAEALIDTDR